MEYLWPLYSVRITIEMAAGKLIFSARFPYLARQLSVRKVVPTLTSKSVEIYLSMAGAKQLVTRDLSRFRPGPYVHQWCDRGTIFHCTVVLAEGGYKRGGRGGRASRSQRFLIEASANIVVKAESVWVSAICLPLWPGDCPSFYRPRRRQFTGVPHCSGYV
jgi:hypothetical protein